MAPRKKKPDFRAQAQEPTQAELIRAQLLRWRKEPELFFNEALGVQLSNQQRELLVVLVQMIVAKWKEGQKKKLTREEKELAGKLGISVHSGKGLGKDWVIAGVIIWFLLCFDQSGGMVTAPSGKQLDDILSKEVKLHLRRSKAGLQQYIEVTRGGIYLKDGSKKSESFFTKRTANIRGSAEEQAETLQGIHYPFMLMIADEASGIPDGVFGPMETTLTDAVNIAVLIGNPTRATGYFYKSHYSQKDRELWVPVRWSALDSDLEEIKPGLTAQVDRIKRKYGVDSNPYRISVLGVPPQSDGNQLIPLEAIYAAVDREIEVSGDEPVVYGVDVGRGGDCSAIVKCRGHKVEKVETLDVRDLRAVADWVAVAIDEGMPDVVAIDGIGLGAGVYDHLRAEGYGDVIRYVNVADRKSRDNRFFNLRADIWWRLREVFEQGLISIPNDEELMFELASVQVEDWEPQMKLKSKKKMLAEGVMSPNRADGLALTRIVRLGSIGLNKRKQDKWDAAFERESAMKAQQDSWMVA